MYLDDISGFVTFLTNNDHTLQEILDHLNRVVFRSLDVNALSFWQLNENNELAVQARSGVSKEFWLKVQSNCSLDDKYPNVVAIKTLSTVWIDTLPDWGNEYPLMKKFQVYFPGKTFLALPIYVTGTPVAVLSMVSNLKLTASSEIDAFLKAIGHIMSMHIYRNVPSSTEEPNTFSDSQIADAKEIDLNLTDRQLVILRLISENRTNLSIAQFLGYSESTIRQEIMKIFAKLGCSHRSEAAKLFRGFASTS